MQIAFLLLTKRYHVKICALANQYDVVWSPEKPSTEEVRQFRQEINMMQSVGRHPNIVSLIGCCTSGGLLRLVVEYCAQGDLLNFLRKVQSVTTHWHTLF
jgi:serine/threonine protein kinase